MTAYFSAIACVSAWIGGVLLIGMRRRWGRRTVYWLSMVGAIVLGMGIIEGTEYWQLVHTRAAITAQLQLSPERLLLVHRVTFQHRYVYTRYRVDLLDLRTGKRLDYATLDGRQGKLLWFPSRNHDEGTPVWSGDPAALGVEGSFDTAYATPRGPVLMFRSEDRYTLIALAASDGSVLWRY